MPTYLQANRPMKVGTTLGANKFLLAGVNGSEGLSMPFHFRLDLRTEDPSIDGKALLRTPISVEIVTPETAKPRRIHGLVSRFVQLGVRDDLDAYAVEVVPWLWFLSLGRNCRIFQNKSVPDIVQQVFKDAGYTDFRLALSGSYAPREYCVQYRESDLAFVSRLLEEEGIFYFFEHEARKHTLVLADVNTAFAVCPGMASAVMGTQAASALNDVVFSLTREDAVHIGKATLRDYNFETPQSNLEASAPGTGPEEAYDYPGGYGSRPDGDRLTKIRIEEAEALQHIVRGESSCRALQAGTKFDLQRHFRADANQSYLVVEATISARAENFRAWEEDGAFVYHNQFLAVPAAGRYRPPRRTPRPVIPGTQTAVVVGKSGEEIWTDKYGRVKVQFYWDRVGGSDDKSSCWVRVASTWAGHNWGAIRVPRIGQEVVVAFLEGDPDHPLVVGSVYNADEMPPYALPGNQTQSGVKSRSSKGGSPSNYNEIQLEDKKGSELIQVQAEKDLATLVKNDETRSVGNDRTTTIKHNDTREVTEGDDVHTIKQGHQTVTVETGNQVVEVSKGYQNITIAKGSHVLDVYKDHTVLVHNGDQVLTVAEGSRTVDVKGDTTLTIQQGNHTVDVQMGDQLIDVQMGNQTVDVRMGDQSIRVRMGNRLVKADLGAIQEQAMQAIEFKCGPSSIKMDPSGITMKALMVKIEGQVQTEVKGGALAKVEGGALLQAKGAIVMIN